MSRKSIPTVVIVSAIAVLAACQVARGVYSCREGSRIWYGGTASNPSDDWDLTSNWYMLCGEPWDFQPAPGPPAYGTSITIGDWKNAGGCWSPDCWYIWQLPNIPPVGPTFDGVLEGVTQMGVGICNNWPCWFPNDNPLTTTITSGGSLSIYQVVGEDNVYGSTSIDLGFKLLVEGDGELETGSLNIAMRQSDIPVMHPEIDRNGYVEIRDNGLITVNTPYERRLVATKGLDINNSYGHIDISDSGRLQVAGDILADCQTSAFMYQVKTGKIRGDGVPGAVTAYPAEIDGQLYTIVEVAGAVGFASSTSSDPETVSPAMIEVVAGRLLLDPSGIYTVDYSVTGGDAVNGSDYNLAAGTLTFNPGQTVKTIDIEIVQDGLDETDETIELTLSGPTGTNAHLGDNSVHTYTIGDPRPDAAFDEASVSVPENIAGAASIPVSLSNEYGLAVTVDYSVTGGTAVNGTDYQLSAGTLTFTAGQTADAIDVTIIDDGDYDGLPKTVVVDLSGPVNCHLGDVTQHTLTITDPRVELAFATPAVLMSAPPGGDLLAAGPDGMLLAAGATVYTSDPGWTYTELADPSTDNITYTGWSGGTGPGAATVANLIDNDLGTVFGGRPAPGSITLDYTSDQTIVAMYNRIELYNNGGSYTIDLIDSGGTTVYTYSGTVGAEHIVELWFEFESPVTFQKETVSMSGHDDFAYGNEFIYYVVTDTDGDGILDNDDNCPDDYNPNQEDSDSDGKGDICDDCPNDPDSDGDGVDDCLDGCPYDPDKIEPGLCGCGVSDTDIDGDGIVCDDNCPYDYNPGQEETDGDGHADACDNCPDDYNPDQADRDGDNAGDICDLCPDDPNKVDPGENGCGVPDIPYGQSEALALAQVPVELTAPTGDAVTVDYSVVGGTATRGVDYFLDNGTLTFEPGETVRLINIDIVQDGLDDGESDETIILELSNLSGQHASFGQRTRYTHTIFHEPIEYLKVDLALPDCTDGRMDNPACRQPVPGTAKDGFWHWIAPRWWDLYRHDGIWEDGSSLGAQPDTDGIAGTGVHSMLGLLYDGDGSLKAAGLTGALAGEVEPSGAPVHDPICNTWYQATDWAEYKWGTIVLTFHGLPPGEYWLYSYHNSFDCYRSGSIGGHTAVSCDSTGVQQPNMPQITAMALSESEDLPAVLDPVGAAQGVYDHYPFSSITHSGLQMGCGGVELVEAAYDVPIQQVTSDSQLNTSLVKFRTDGTPVLIVYENGCCVTDTVRPGRSGGRAILNAFELKIAEVFTEAAALEPCDGGEGLVDIRDCPVVCTAYGEEFLPLQWTPTYYAGSHDVYFGTNEALVTAADRQSPQYVGSFPRGSESYDYGELSLGGTYYWRIDEVNDTKLWKGHTWSFNVRPCRRIEDFEQYHGKTIYHQAMSQLLGKWTASGGSEDALSVIWELPEELAEYCEYSSTGLWGKYGEVQGVEPVEIKPRPCWGLNNTWLELGYYNLVYAYSEASTEFACPIDLTLYNSHGILIDFRGEADNMPDRLYMVLEDTGGRSVELVYGGPSSDMQVAWPDKVTWSIGLDELSAVDASQIARLTLGVGQPGGSASSKVGTMYFNDIRQCVGQCLPESARPAKDHNEDCVVNFGDHAMDPAVTSGDMQQYRDFAAAWLEETLWP